MRIYQVGFVSNVSDKPRYFFVDADNKENAYEKAMDKLEWKAYGAWVSGYVSKNGTYHSFNNFLGKPY